MPFASHLVLLERLKIEAPPGDAGFAALMPSCPLLSGAFSRVFLLRTKSYISLGQFDPNALINREKMSPMALDRARFRSGLVLAARIGDYVASAVSPLAADFTTDQFPTPREWERHN